MKALLLLSLAIFGQNNLPTYGEISEIKTFTRVYVSAEDGSARARIVKALSKNKSLQVVNAPEEAQFFLEYSDLSRDAVSSRKNSTDRRQRSQMRAYIKDGEKQIVVWADTRSRDTEDFGGMKMYDSGHNEDEQTKKFLKALKKAN